MTQKNNIDNNLYLMYDTTHTLLEHSDVNEDSGVIVSHHAHTHPTPSFIGFFGISAVAVFFGFVVFLTAIDFYPEPIVRAMPEASSSQHIPDQVAPEPAIEVVNVVPVVEPVAPTRVPVAVAATLHAPQMVIIDSLSITAPVMNPTATDIASLDAALLKGAVHYPGSANLRESGNMVIFGHSSYLPVVRNQAYKAFNGLQNLTKDNLVRVRSQTDEEVYRVTSVRLASASAEEVIVLSTNEKTLTLVTCNTFGEKADRWVVTAEFVGRYPIAS